MTEYFDDQWHLQFQTDYILSKNYETIKNVRYFPIQILSIQSLIDSIFLNIVLTKEVIKFLDTIDENTDSIEVDLNNLMYK